MNRRNFLGAMLAACAAPAVVRAGSLMRINPAIVVPDDKVVVLKQFSAEIGRVERFTFYEDLDPATMYASNVGARLQLIREQIYYDALKGNLK